jgi:FKBP-type peptidyl-prolyl cis-trans isomerase (trigger factor)
VKILSNNRSGNQITLEIEVDYARFQDAYDKALEKAGKQVRLQGFRPGKAPKDMLERSVDKEYLNSLAIQECVSEQYPQIIEQTKIDPVDFPKVDVVTLEKGKAFVFKIEVDVYPEVKLGQYKGLKLEKLKVAVSDEEVMKVLTNLQERYSIANAEGKKEIMPLDDEFAKKVSNFGSLAELKAEINTTMLKERTEHSLAEVKNKAVALVSNDAQIAIPKAMIDREVDVMVDELKHSLSMSNLTLDAYLKAIKKEELAMREELAKSAEIRVKGKVALQAVAEAEKIKVSDEEMAQEIKDMAQASGKKEEEVKESITEGMQKYITDYMLRKKALDFILEKAKITEVDKLPEEKTAEQGAEAKEEEAK